MSLPLSVQARAEAIQAEVERFGAELVEITCSRLPGRSVLRVVADKPGGITLEDCAELSRALGEFLDRSAEDPQLPVEAGGFLGGSYVLEVMSPGLDRPLKSERDFKRAMGQKIRVLFKRDGKVLTLTGRLAGAESGVVLIESEQEASGSAIPMTDIVKAARVIEF